MGVTSCQNRQLMKQNDTILGYCARTTLAINIGYLSQFVPGLVERHLAEDVVRALNWLDDWPVGLKLNTPLSGFYCSSFAAVITAWRGESSSPEES